ncbi:hypothetical protein [Methylosarcina fibrata]|uniref:hypothetical protein n=1 Tax=Methylosarcina fibrata TaxID=105972 RepID=UPI0003747FFB|nr:hypothetical protein [Methylosarcina fibrata]
MLDGILDDILGDSPKRGEIRPDSPFFRPAQTRVNTGLSPDSPNSPNSPTTHDKTAILAWLHFIGETDQAMIDDVLDYCAGNPDALAYYLERAEEVPLPDDRHHCRECRNLNSRGYCIRQRFRPVDDLPRRCEDFNDSRIQQ